MFFHGCSWIKRIQITAYANTEKANTILGWKTKLTLEEAIASA
jgi:nucleoside-diphosphate-sugar epimerase